MVGKFRCCTQRVSVYLKGYGQTTSETARGFTLANGWSYSGQSVDYSMAEFFVLSRYRHQGVGQGAFETILKEHPGVWESA